MPDCLEKVIRAKAILPFYNCVIPASAFRHQGQSGTAGHELTRHCQAMAIICTEIRIYSNGNRFTTHASYK
jgi:hypothetical protein